MNFWPLEWRWRSVTSIVYIDNIRWIFFVSSFIADSGERLNFNSRRLFSDLKIMRSQSNQCSSDTEEIWRSDGNQLRQERIWGLYCDISWLMVFFSDKRSHMQKNKLVGVILHIMTILFITWKFGIFQNTKPTMTKYNYLYIW